MWTANFFFCSAFCVTAWLANLALMHWPWLLAGGVHRDRSTLCRYAAEGVAVRLALPMTLNNIAGGLAGGVAGVPPALALLFAFSASFIMMLAGHALGRLAGARMASWLDARLAAGFIFGALAVVQLTEAWASAGGGVAAASKAAVGKHAQRKVQGLARLWRHGDG